MNSNNPLTTIMKIMNLFLKNMGDSPAPPPQDSPLVDKLVKKGFRPEDIATAMRCLGLMAVHSGAGPGPDPTPTDSGELRATGIRQLHATEAIRLTSEAQHLLLGLLEGGQISPLHFEKTIEYIWKNDLRDVGASRLQLILYMNDPNPGRGEMPFLSDRVAKPEFLN